MIGYALAVVLGVAGLWLGRTLGNGMNLLSDKEASSSVEMWRLGAEHGPTERDRMKAQQRVEMRERIHRQIRPISRFGNRIVLPLGFGIVGFALGRTIGANW